MVMSILEESDMCRQCAFYMRVLFASMDLMVMLFKFKAVVIEYRTCTLTCGLVIHIWNRFLFKSRCRGNIWAVT